MATRHNNWFMNAKPPPELRDAHCTRCVLHKTCHSVCVGGTGSRTALLMIVGEAPGRDEDLVGEPFVGRSGRLLDYALERLSIPRESVFLTNVVKCRPPDSKLPTKTKGRPAIVEACRKYLDEEIAEVRPRVILAMGATALSVLTHGKYAALSTWQCRRVQENIFAGYHPNFVLHKPSEERKFVLAIRVAAAVAGIPMTFNHAEHHFDYDAFN